MQIPTLTVVGVGLIGGSLGLAAKRRGVAGRVLGVGRRPEPLDVARQMGAIDEGRLELEAAAAESDLVVFCTPVNLIAEQVRQCAPCCRPGTLLTDAGSTKAAIVNAIEGELPAGVAFVGSHPLAGSEKRGPEFADADLYRDRLTVVTRTEQTDADAVRRVAAFWEAVGSRVRVMSPEEHDRALAVTSHLPHFVASVLASLLPGELYGLTATGFRDTTRIAAGDPSIWTGIFQQNREAVLRAVDQFADRLTLFRDALAADDLTTLDSLLTEAKKVRDALGNRHHTQGT